MAPLLNPIKSTFELLRIGTNCLLLQADFEEILPPLLDIHVSDTWSQIEVTKIVCNTYILTGLIIVPLRLKDSLAN